MIRFVPVLQYLCRNNLFDLMRQDLTDEQVDKQDSQKNTDIQIPLELDTTRNPLCFS